MTFEWIYLISGLCLGAVLSFFVSSIKRKDQNKKDEIEKRNLLERETRAIVRAEQLERRLQEQKLEFDADSEKLFQRFQNLSHKMLDENTEKLRERNEKGLGAVLAPLKEKITEFERKVAEAYGNEARERFALKQEIKQVAEINMKMSAEASNLTKALKGDVKTQGSWGEIILERILEASGLREGSEYTLQGKDMRLQGEDGRILRPDAIINLPEKKHIIVDSKVSLLSFEAFSNAENEGDRQLHLKAFFLSVDAHIKGLASKHYASAKGLNSPDFVFLFMPIEAAFLTYAKENQGGFSQAWEKKVMIVGPSTLWPCLTTVSSLWKSERQNQNAQRIADFAGSLYDKFAGFAEDLDRVGKGLGLAQNSYDEAVLKLKSGKGNLLRQTERLKELGARTKKQLDIE